MNCCSVLLFPTAVEFVPVDIPIKELCLWKKVVCAEAIFHKKKCCLRVVDAIDRPDYDVNIYQGYIQKYCPEGIKPISPKAFFDLKNAFGDSFRMMGMGTANPSYMLRGWNFDNKPHYFMETELSDFKEQTEKNAELSVSAGSVHAVRMMEPMTKVCSSFEYVFMAGTLFSICKPLFLHYNIKANLEFCLQVEIKKTHKAEDILKQMLLGHFADMWCNYRDWKNRDKKNWAHFKFWNKDGVAEVFFAPWNHLNFPLVFSDHSRISWDSAKHCDIDAGNVRGFLSKQEVRNIGNASCLPILLPLRKTEKPYQVKDCLNLIWDLSDNMEQIDKMAACFEPTVSNKKKLSRRHREIIRFYVEFLDFLNELVNVENDKKAVAKLLRNSYTDALLDLGAMPAKATIEQQEKACLLGSMYLAKDVLKESRYLTSLNTLLEAAIKDLEYDLGVA